MDLSIIQCYNCDYEDNCLNTILCHIQDNHKDCEVKFRQYILCTLSGRLPLQTKSISLKPSDLGEGETLQFDEISNIITIKRMGRPSVIGTSPPLKKARQQLNATEDKPKSQLIGSDNEEDDVDHRYIQSVLPDAVKTIKKAGFLHEFNELHRMLANGSFPLDNITFLMFIELIKWKMGQSAVKHHDAVKRFFKIGYRLFHGPWLRFMRGLGGDHINFVVPDEKTLVAFDVMPALQSSQLLPGIIEPMMDLFPEGSVVKLAVDGKKINISPEQEMGAVDLWGHESPPTAKQRNERLEKENKLVSQILEELETYNGSAIEDVGPNLNETLVQNTKQLLTVNTVKPFNLASLLFSVFIPQLY